MAKKLYKAEVTCVYYFMAEEGKEDSEARSLMDDAIRDDSLITPDVSEVTRFEDTMDWDDPKDSLVYGTDKDTTLAEAFNESTGKDFDKEGDAMMERFNARKPK